MGESKAFIKHAVGLVLVVAMCLMAVVIYQKGRESIQHSMSTLDALFGKMEQESVKQYEGTVVSGYQVLELLRGLEEADGVAVQVKNGVLRTAVEGKRYTYAALQTNRQEMLEKMQDPSEAEYYINATALFRSSVIYDGNGAPEELLFVQEP